MRRIRVGLRRMRWRKRVGEGGGVNVQVDKSNKRESQPLETFWILQNHRNMHADDILLIIMFCHSKFDIDSYYSMNCISIPIPIATRLRMRSSIEVLFRYALICMACDFKQFYWFVVEMKVNRPLKWRRGEFFISLILIDKSKSASISKRIRTFIRIERLETCFTEDELPDQLKWTYVGVYICWACANNKYHDTCRIFFVCIHQSGTLCDSFQPEINFQQQFIELVTVRLLWWRIDGKLNWVLSIVGNWARSKRTAYPNNVKQSVNRRIFLCSLAQVQINKIYKTLNWLKRRNGIELLTFSLKLVVEIDDDDSNDAQWRAKWRRRRRKIKVNIHWKSLFELFAFFLMLEINAVVGFSLIVVDWAV